ncbi:MAG: N-acetyltransferase, partial [Bacteroidetes bacterium]
MTIIELSSRPNLLEKGIQYFWNQWGNDKNFEFYKNCIDHSLDEEKALPKFYLALEKERIIGSYALIVNDLVSRQDLMPWLACLYVEEDCRGRGVAETLLKHGLKETRKKGFSHLYLSTDLEGFYEKKGWLHVADTFNLFGEKFKVYS